MAKNEIVVLTNMCMIYDDKGNIVVQNRVDPEWSGVTFPGGHVELGESFTQSVIREVYEETGLTISHPEICGIKQFPSKDGARYIVLFYKTDKFTGKLRSTSEGKVFWINEKDLSNYPLAKDFEEMFEIFKNDDLQEYQWVRNGFIDLEIMMYAFWTAEEEHLRQLIQLKHFAHSVLKTLFQLECSALFPMIFNH